MINFGDRVICRLIFPGVLSCLLVGCNSQSSVSSSATPTPTPTQVVTDVNAPNFVMADGDGVSVTRSQVDRAVDIFLRQHNKTVQDVGPSKMPLVQTGVLDNLVMTQLFLNEAQKVSLPTLQADEKAAFERFSSHFTNHDTMVTNLKGLGLSEEWVKNQIHEQTVQVRILEKEVYQDVKPNQAMLMEIYTKNLSRFQTPKKVRVSRILVHADSSMDPKTLASKQALIKKAAAEIKAGKDFSSVAKVYSEDVSSATAGGDLGYVAPGESEVGFDEMAFQMKVGQTSPVFRTELGFQIIRLTDLHPAGTLKFDDVESNLLQVFVDQKHREQEETFCRKMLADSKVVYHFKRVELSDAEAAAGGDSAPAGN